MRLQIGDKLSRRLAGLFGRVAFQPPQISQQFLIFLVYTFRIVGGAFVVAVFGRIRFSFLLFAGLFLLGEARDDGQNGHRHIEEGNLLSTFPVDGKRCDAASSTS